jgi:hypothetical protein
MKTPVHLIRVATQTDFGSSNVLRLAKYMGWIDVITTIGRIPSQKLDKIE